jgi:hypothetical protein
VAPAVAVTSVAVIVSTWIVYNLCDTCDASLSFFSHRYRYSRRPRASDTVEFALRAAIGFFGALACIVFLAGFVIYVTRLGTERREDGIKVMEKGVTIIMVVILAAGVLYWLE